MSRKNQDDEEFDWREVERRAKNIKDAAQEIEEQLLDGALPKKKKGKLKRSKFRDDDY